MYDFQLPLECRDFSEVCADQAAYPKSMFPTDARDIVHRPFHRKLDAAISATLHVNEPKRASMNIDAREQIVPQLGRILQKLRQLWRPCDPRCAFKRDLMSTTTFFVQKNQLAPPGVGDEISSALSL